MIFYNSIGNINVVLSNVIYNKLLYLCDEKYPYETGGILIGNYSADCNTANILDVLAPPTDSKHQHYNFQRGVKGLKTILDKMWKHNKYYLGEWHYHPNSTSNPSSTDILQMYNLASNSKLCCPEPILIIIGGKKDNWNLSVMIFKKNTYEKLSVDFFADKSS